jgi:hypothetical protein
MHERSTISQTCELGLKTTDGANKHAPSEVHFTGGGDADRLSVAVAYAGKNSTLQMCAQRSPH